MWLYINKVVQAVDKPYAGVFETFLLPNNDLNLEMRLGQLVHAVKMVYASAYKSEAQAYLIFERFFLFSLQ